MRKLIFFSVLGCAVSALALAACSSSTTTSSGVDGGGATNDSGGNDSGGLKDTGGGGFDAGGDGFTPLNGCVTFTDHTSGGDPRSITWDLIIASSPDRCMRIKAGQSVTWDGDFAMHPLEQAGGQTPSPIGNGSGTTPKVIAFPNTGDYGYDCAAHPGMRGVIRVEP